MAKEFERKEILKPYVVKLENNKQAEHWAKAVEGWQAVTDLSNYPNYATVDSIGDFKGDLSISTGIDKHKELVSYDKGCELIKIKPIT